MESGAKIGSQGNAPECAIRCPCQGVRLASNEGLTAPRIVHRRVAKRSRTARFALRAGMSYIVLGSCS